MVYSLVVQIHADLVAIASVHLAQLSRDQEGICREALRA